MNDVIIKVDNLVRHFGKVRAVDYVSFTVKRGQVFGFIGPNGAGKTTTMRILATLDLPQHGDAFVDGHSVITSHEKVRAVMGFMPDYAGVYPNTTVLEYLDFFARSYRIKGEARRKAVDNIIDFMGIGELRDRPVEHLSKGLKQRVALGRALIHDPQVLILDEPAAGLDPRARIEFRTLIKELANDGKTVFLSSHILTELSEICDAVAIIEQGKILATGTVNEILSGLRRHRILAMRVNDRHDEAHRFLLEQPGVLQIRQKNGELEFDFDGDETAQMQLLNRLLGAGFMVVEFKAREADLEDVFMKVTEGKVQ